MSKLRTATLSVLAMSGFLMISAGHVSAEMLIQKKKNVEAPLEYQSFPVTVTEALTLNDGQKWMMDKHTRDVFLKMSEYFFSFDYKASTEGELKDVGVKLQNYLDKLISGCTMSGAEHDQLHTYLMEYMPAVEGLSKSGKLKHAEIIAVYLKKYGEYFK